MKPVQLLLLVLAASGLWSQPATEIDILLEDFTLETFPAPPSRGPVLPGEEVFDPPLLPATDFQVYTGSVAPPWEVTSPGRSQRSRFWEGVILLAQPEGGRYSTGVQTQAGRFSVKGTVPSDLSFLWNYQEQFALQGGLGHQTFHWQAGTVLPWKVFLGQGQFRAAGGKDEGGLRGRAGGELSWSWGDFWVTGGGDLGWNTTLQTLFLSGTLGLAWTGPLTIVLRWGPEKDPLELAWGRTSKGSLSGTVGGRWYRWSAGAFLRSDNVSGQIQDPWGVEGEGDLILDQNLSLGLRGQWTGQEVQGTISLQVSSVEGAFGWSSAENWLLSLKVGL